MSVAENKQLMHDIFAALSEGNGQPFIDSLADDFTWTLTGSTAWSKTYVGKAAVLNDLFRPLFAQFADRYTNVADRIIAEDDIVVVECHGQVTTKAGHPYNNRYCWVCHIRDGKLQSLTEYMDTQLVATVLADPERIR
jgi:hypothetical protein